MGGVEVDEADDAVVGLEGNGEHAADLLFDDAHAFLEYFVEAGVADEQGGFVAEDAVADGVADAEAIASGGADDELVGFEGHEDAAGGPDGVDGEIHDKGEEFGEGAVAGEFAAGADEGANLGVGFEAGDAFFIVLEDAGEAGDDGAVGAGGGFLGIDENDGVGGGGRGAELDDEVAGGDAVAGAEEVGGVDALAIDEGAVFAAEVAHDPGIAGGFEGEVLAGEAGVVGKAEFAGGGAPEGDAGAVELDRSRGAVGAEDANFAGYGRLCGRGHVDSVAYAEDGAVRLFVSAARGAIRAASQCPNRA